ncbi:MAG TPA: erythromycin esterase family protein [Hanamia sp.]|nr:erythromycin esterase family protein [Hanamia sp.]
MKKNLRRPVSRTTARTYFTVIKLPLTKFYFTAIFFLLVIATTAQTLSTSELDAIQNSIAKKNIIGFGEPEHFYKGYYDSKIEIIKYLILHKKIDAIFFEASAAECRNIDRYVKGASNDSIIKTLHQLNEGYNYRKEGLFDCDEILNFLQWLRRKNMSTEKKVSVYGIDFQNAQTPIEELKNILKSNTHLQENLDSLQDNFDSLLKEMIENPVKIYMDTTWKKLATRNYLLAKTVRSLIKESDTKYWSNFYGKQLEEYAYIYTDPNLQRDSLMFENFKLQYHSQERVLLWAADFHIANDSTVNHMGRALTLGAFLKKEYGAQYFTIALDEDKEPVIADFKRIIFPIPKGNEAFQKYDMIIKCKKGDRASRLN